MQPRVAKRSRAVAPSLWLGPHRARLNQARGRFDRAESGSIRALRRSDATRWVPEGPRLRRSRARCLCVGCVQPGEHQGALQGAAPRPSCRRRTARSACRWHRPLPKTWSTSLVRGRRRARRGSRRWLQRSATWAQTWLFLRGAVQGSVRSPAARPARALERKAGSPYEAPRSDTAVRGRYLHRAAKKALPGNRWSRQRTQSRVAALRNSPQGKGRFYAPSCRCVRPSFRSPMCRCVASSWTAARRRQRPLALRQASSRPRPRPYE